MLKSIGNTIYAYAYHQSRSVSQNVEKQENRFSRLDYLLKSAWIIYPICFINFKKKRMIDQVAPTIMVMRDMAQSWKVRSVALQIASNYLVNDLALFFCPVFLGQTASPYFLLWLHDQKIGVFLILIFSDCQYRLGFLAVLDTQHVSNTTFRVRLYEFAGCSLVSRFPSHIRIPRKRSSSLSVS